MKASERDRQIDRENTVKKHHTTATYARLGEREEKVAARATESVFHVHCHLVLHVFVVCKKEEQRGAL